MSQRPIDLRSDTVTRPSAGMRAAMAAAEVGDDVYGEDPTVRRLEARCAAMFGHEAGLFVASGTMANQLAACLHLRPGEELLLAPESHVWRYESGGLTANAGAQPHFIGERGVFGAADIDAAVRPRTDYNPRTRVVWFENTHNVAGGRVFPFEALRAASERARHHGLQRHLDGARILNACAASGVAPAAYGALFDTMSLCFSKGLGAPVGSILLGSRDHVAELRWLRRRFGGAMRQVGVLAAAAEYGLDHHAAGLAQDHAHAKALAAGVAALKHARLDPGTVETNIVIFDVAPEAGTAETVVARLAAAGVLMNATGPQRIRMVTHRDVAAGEVPAALAALAGVLD